MNRVRILVLIAALAAAGLAAYLASGMLAKKPGAPKAVAVEVKKPVIAEVLIAARDVALGEKLGSQALVWREWPAANTEGMITREAHPNAIDDMAPARARQPIFSGEPMLERKLLRSENNSFMSAILPQGMRAIAVAISEHSGVSGFILPNDRVDVIVTRKYESAPPGPAGMIKQMQKLAKTETILTNVRVLAINQTFRQEGDDKVTVPEGKTAVLELEPLQAQILTKVEALGELSLTLRSIAEEDGRTRNSKPVLAEAYKRQGGATEAGALVVRYGAEMTVNNP